ncbi:MAG: hypothetical protein ACI8UX_000543 [Psychromonas sp.]|jgi:hypothetical protein
MSFDKKIREKLVNHIPKYDSGAWNNFQKMLPAPWYMKLFQSSAGWIIGGLSTTALLFTVYNNTTKTELLNEEITTLKNQIERTASLSNERSTVTQIDTVYITRDVKKSVPTETPINRAYMAGVKDAKTAANKDINYLKNELATLREKALKNERKSDLKETDTSLSDELAGLKTTQAESNSKRSLTEDNAIRPTSDSINKGLISHGELAQPQQTKKPIENSVNLAVLDSKENNASNVKETIMVADVDGSSDAHNLKLPSGSDNPKEAIAIQEDILKIHELKVQEQQPLRIDPEKSKKKLKLPVMRFGVNTDYLGLKVFATGPTLEIFLGDKLSFNSSVLFSNQIVTQHRFTKDFNNKTGKQFEQEFKRFLNQRPEVIQDISIKTSFIKLPLYFNYYINTWSRFNFIISGGTKLDLSVYQDIDYFTGPINQRLKSRFEARPKAKVFNNLYYGMGVQYKYKNFVGQMTPYFDFAFRRPDYFTPTRNFGINAALKFEFGN